MLNIETMLGHVLYPFYAPEFVSGTERPGMFLNNYVTKLNKNKCTSLPGFGVKRMNGKGRTGGWLRSRPSLLIPNK